MAAAPFALEAIQLEKNSKVWNILEIGLGTGILNSFLHDFSNVCYFFIRHTQHTIFRELNDLKFLLRQLEAVL